MLKESQNGLLSHYLVKHKTIAHLRETFIYYNKCKTVFLLRVLDFPNGNTVEGKIH